VEKAVGFVGTGIMGGHMARRLARGGYRVRAWNRTPGKTAPLAAEGIEVVENAADAGTGADVVICMLSSGPVCDEVLLSAGGVIEAMRTGSTLIVMSSIPVDTARLQSARAGQHGVRYIDAPVSGGETGAREGTLAIMAGGDAGQIASLSAMFATMGRVTHVGPTGSGQLAKLANQLIVASNICAVAEALVLAERGGADPAKVREALLGGFADSTVFRQHGQRMVDGNFTPGGPAKYQVKDTGTALALASALGLNLPVATEVDRIFRGLVEHGGAELDHSAAILELKHLNRDPSVAHSQNLFHVEEMS
jgi:3-hydroxyisobutyrate dehydrogenase-like beta-hydroxyacid dehydrogenase